MGNQYVIRGLLSGLTPSEKVYLIGNPHHFPIIKAAADKALKEAKRLFPGKAQHNGTGDAFRHCYWSALLARELGAANAHRFTTAHEDYSDNPPGERAMDLHNNMVGNNIGQLNSRTTDFNLSVLCKDALDKGKLMTSPPDVRTGY